MQSYNPSPLTDEQRQEIAEREMKRLNEIRRQNQEMSDRHDAEKARLKAIAVSPVTHSKDGCMTVLISHVEEENRKAKRAWDSSDDARSFNFETIRHLLLNRNKYYGGMSEQELKAVTDRQFTFERGVTEFFITIKD